MKFALAELQKFKFPYEFSEILDLSADLVGIEDILAVSNTEVSGIIRYISDEKYKIDFIVKTKLILESSISLKEIPYDLNIEFSENFSYLDDDESFKFNGQTLDTKEAIITNILINKPMSQSLEDETFVSEAEEETEYVNEAFKSLKDLL